MHYFTIIKKVTPFFTDYNGNFKQAGVTRLQ